ncbi:Tetratricopeptide TPR_3 [Methanocaldococcus sp. FS406-22]|uniref:tetratricopeptide repeat protein n=1 Tax=Methanocaldococcus sp. (strain FS406-22) TaxID=644281 RepID=UPI0001BF09D9|nr:tetratricopeptide repeat protein [Methanocaldococcus sp. FS406-22]ADC68925.1 Tetratricopeptide TPR_3 [Methanocaldococcus sp. FS406-22]
MTNNWLNSLYKYWLKGCEFYNKGDYDKAIEYFNLVNKIFKENTIEYDYYELREDAYKEILNNNIEEGIKKFVWFVEGILADRDYYDLSGELLTIASIFAKIGRLDIVRCFLNRGAEWIYNDDIKNANPEEVLKSILTDAFSDDEREEILNKEPNLKKPFEDITYYFNLDFFDFMMSFFIGAGNWKRFLKVYEEFKNKIKNCQISEETANKIIERFDEPRSDLLAIAHLLKGNYEKCLYCIELFKKSFNLDEFDEIYKEEINFIENIANNLKNGVIKKEEWLNRLNEIYADILNQPLPKTYKEAYHNHFLDEILMYCILKEFIEKL